VIWFPGHSLYGANQFFVNFNRNGALQNLYFHYNSE
jgi:hypothetical protein